MSVHLYDDLKAGPSLETQALGADATVDGAGVSAAVDGESAYSEALAYIDVGAWTDGTHTFSLEDDEDDGNGAPAGTWAAVPAARQVGGASVAVSDATGENAQHFVGAIIGAGRPWVRVTVTSTGTSTGLADVEAHIVMGGASSRAVR